MEGTRETDSPLEERRFEPSVPRFRDGPFRLCGTSRSARETDSFRERDRQFESASLQRRVCLASAFHAYRRKDRAFARSVSLDVTRERDVLATSRLALAPFL